MIKIFRRMFGGSPKKKKKTKERKKAENVYEKVDIKPPPLPEPRPTRDSKLFVQNDLYETARDDVGGVGSPYGKSKFSDAVMKQIGVYDEIEFERKRDEAAESLKKRTLTDTGMPRARKSYKYNHMKNFTLDQRRDNYDTLIRDNNAPEEPLKKSHSAEDLRDNNNYIVKVKSPEIKVVANVTSQLNGEVRNGHVSGVTRRYQQTQKSYHMSTTNVRMSNSVTVEQAVSYFRSENSSRIITGTRTVGRPVIPLEHNTKQVAFANSITRAISKENVNALRTQFDFVSRNDPYLRKQRTSNPPFVGRIPKQTSLTNDIDELSESFLFNTMKDRLNSAS